MFNCSEIFFCHLPARGRGELRFFEKNQRIRRAPTRERPGNLPRGTANAANDLRLLEQQGHRPQCPWGYRCLLEFSRSRYKQARPCSYRAEALAKNALSHAIKE